MQSTDKRKSFSIPTESYMKQSVRVVVPDLTIFDLNAQRRSSCDLLRL
jgi:hypothetical protein